MTARPSRRGRDGWGVIAAAAFLAVATRARASDAQTPRAPAPPDAVPANDDAAARARASFETGIAALQDERYADALVAFNESYRLRRVASVALNLGVTLRALGRLAEARARFQEFLELANPAQHTQYDQTVLGYIAEIGRRVGRVRVATLSPAEASVRIDGRAAALDAQGEVTVDPGEHEIAADASGFQPARQRVTVDPGGRAEVRLVLEPVAPASAPPPPPRAADTVPGATPVVPRVVRDPLAPTPPRASARRSGAPPTGFIVLGVAGGALVVGAIVTAVLVATAPLPDPAATNTGIVVQAVLP